MCDGGLTPNADSDNDGKGNLGIERNIHGKKEGRKEREGRKV